MLAGMLVRRTRVLWFTLAVVALFMMGCGASAVSGADPETPEGVEQDDLATIPAEQAPPVQAAPAPQIADSAPPVTQVAAQGGYEDTDPSALTEFRDELAPHGSWVEDPAYGLVWVPAANEVGADFAPYVTAGHWALTEDGDWLWVSDYSWGWAAFHYGRWVWIPGTGWAWIPGRAYAPAWVVWRVGEPGYDYIGWAPMPPSYYWSGGVAVALWVVPPAPYVFCETAYVFDPYPYNHLVVGVHVHDVAHHTHYYYPDGHHGGGHGARPHGPSMDQARVPASAVPRTAARPEPRAEQAARPRNAASYVSRGGSAKPTSRSLGAAGAPRATRGVSDPTYRGLGSHSVAPTRRAAPLSTVPAYRTSRGASTTIGTDRYGTSPPTMARPTRSYDGRSYGQGTYDGRSSGQGTYDYGRPSYGRPATGFQQPYIPQARGSSPVAPYRSSARPGTPGAPTAVQPAKPSSRPAAAPARGRGRGRR